jgi:hypothetical protein
LHRLKQADFNMRRQDFLHRDVETGLCQHYLAAGAMCSLSTNCEQLLETARDTFLPVEMPQAPVDFSVRFWVDGAGVPQASWPKPYVRGLGHLVFVGFDSSSSMLADLRTRRVIGRFSLAMASDARYWKMVIFPMLLSIVAGSVGLVELHASCVAKDQRGLILAGPSRSGKSTLAMALTEAGFRLLSDDRTFCSSARGKLQAWGLPRPLKLRREAASWFEEFRDREPKDLQNGERVFHFEPKQRSIPKCEPQLLVFLERGGRGFAMAPMKKSELRSRIEADLLAEVPDAIRKQAASLDELLSLPCCLLRYGGQPQEIAQRLAASFLSIPESQTSTGARWRTS